PVRRPDPVHQRLPRVRQPAPGGHPGLRHTSRGLITMSQTIDRRELVGRHDVRVAGVDPASPLSVGNGDFACTVDLTGLQSIPEAYPVSARDPSRPAGTLL